VLNYPFLDERDFDLLGLDAHDDRRHVLRLANPISAEAPAMRSTLLPGLLAAAARNLGRGLTDVALFEIGSVVLRGSGASAPRLAVTRRPDPDELTALLDAVPPQPRHVAAVLVGDRQPAGWAGPSRPVDWSDAVELARVVARAAGVELDVVAGALAPWHPGRCAELRVDGSVVGHAGELHPRVVDALRLPPRAAAVEIDLDAIPLPAGPVTAPTISTYPPAVQDVALVVSADTPAAAVEAALRAGAGALLEAIHLFDRYEGEQVGEGRCSLAYTLRFRAQDRTLTADEVAEARDAAVAEAGRRTGAELRH
jgi:phenylalanyl-tRNA synthetase beta chain